MLEASGAIFGRRQKNLKLCQQARANYQRAGGGFLCFLLEIEISDPVCWRKCPDYEDLYANFSLKRSFRST